MDEDAIRDALVTRGEEILSAPQELVDFSGDPEADELLNDLEGHPHAFVIACLLDRQVKAEVAWTAPLRMKERLGTFSFERLAGLSEKEVVKMMSSPTPLHRFPDKMARNVHRAVEHIQEEYAGNACRIWSGRPSSALVVYRFLQFRGVGPKIATMAANILARDFKVQFSDYYSIDVSADVHVRRVFGRLGLAAPGASVEATIFRARSMNPEFPGLLDLPAWEVGRAWCRPKKPLCGNCFLKGVCPTGKLGIG